ncbi:MAG: recombinase family protein [Anaerolineales bacterium]|nr:recombinase family protein [Anaerolineales bacterium]
MAAQQLNPGIAHYLRVSSDNKQHPAESFEYQRQRIETCFEHSDIDLPVVMEYCDVLTGKTSQRPGFQDMLEGARQGLFSHLGVYSIDRIGRNHVETLDIIEELSDLGITIIAADSPHLDFDTPNGNLFLRIRVAIAQYEIEMTSQRVEDSKKASLRSGNRPFQLPDGYRRKEKA